MYLFTCIMHTFTLPHLLKSLRFVHYEFNISTVCLCVHYICRCACIVNGYCYVSYTCVCILVEFSGRVKTWKLKIAKGASTPGLRTLNNHSGRQIWEFDPNLGSPEELAEIEKVRGSFHDNRFDKKQSSDLLMRIQVSLLA